MKNKIFFCFVSIFFISLVIAINGFVDPDSVYQDSNRMLNSSEQQEVIIVFKDNINQTLLENNNITIKENIESIDVSIGKASQDSINSLEENPNIEVIESDLKLELLEENSTNINLTNQIIPWGVERVNAPKVWNKISGKEIKIAVIDSGINKDHPDLKNNIRGGVSFINNTEYSSDDLGHGTSVAGVIAASNNEIGVVGVAPDTELYSVKVIGASGGKLSNFIQGIQWAINNNMSIIVMSLGISVDSPSLNRMVNEAYSKGIILVAASGKNNQIYYPAKYSSVIAVGSVNEKSELTSENGAGDELEFVAPGENIISTSINGYNSYDGTSMAAPHVAGIAALIKENYPSWTNNDIRAKLQRDAIDLGNKSKDNYFGYGLASINLSDRNLNATIQIIFPETLNETNFTRVEIINIEDGKENIVQTLFYNINLHIVNISVEPGAYKIKQYFENNTYEGNYNVSEGDLVVVTLHVSVVHGYITTEAMKIWNKQEILDYSSTIKSASQDEPGPGIISGCNHFWEPYSNSCSVSGCGSGYYCNPSLAKIYYDNAIYYYNSNKQLSYQYLGWTIHLLEDMGMPAHVNLDSHPISDSYEDYMSTHYLNYNSNGLTYISTSDLYSLFYNMAIKSRNYDSDDVNGLIDKGSRNTCNILRWCTISITNCQIIGNTLIPQAMSHVAGLYKLFWMETHNLTACTSGSCCDTSLGIPKTYGQQPIGWNDYYYVSGTNSPVDTSYIIFRDYYCDGFNTYASSVDSTYATCGICKYANNGANVCSNYDNSTIYDSTLRCSSGTGIGKYNQIGDYKCQESCDGSGNRGYASNCIFDVGCASQNPTKLIVNMVGWPTQNLLINNKINLTIEAINKTAKEIKIYDNIVIVSNCTQCQIINSTLNLKDGTHLINVSIKDYTNDPNNFIQNSTKIIVDTKSPIIHFQLPDNKTRVPSSIYNFSVTYSEENIKFIKLIIKNNIDNLYTNIKNSSECSSGINQTCNFYPNLTQFDKNQIAYWFEIQDIANRTINSSYFILDVGVICYNNSQCGTDLFIGNNFCSRNNITGSYLSFICMNPNTIQSYCSNSTTFQLIIDCGNNSCSNFGLNYCKGNTVYNNQTCIFRGCSNGSCINNSFINETFVKNCSPNQICQNGNCICIANLTNTTWSDWKNISCLIIDKINQTRNRTQYDSNNCNGSINSTVIEYRTTDFCDNCIPNWTCVNRENRIDDYSYCINVSDLNDCYKKTQLINDTYQGDYSEFPKIKTDYCQPIPLNTSWSSWQNQTVCSIKDTKIQNRSRIEYDSNYNNCYLITKLPSDLWNNGENKIYWDNQTVYCNYCSQDIQGPFYTDWSGCDRNSIKQNRIKFYIDNNYSKCCAVTKIEDDCQIDYDPSYWNETQYLTCPQWPIIIISPIDGGKYDSQSINLSTLSNETLVKIEYIDYFNINKNSGWRTLCTNKNKCSKFTRFVEGNHLLIARGTSMNKNIYYDNVTFFIDSFEPKINKIIPVQNSFVNSSSKLIVEFSDDNPAWVDLYINGNKTKGSIVLNTKNRQIASFGGIFENYDGQLINYYFIIKDIAGNTKQSKPIKIYVDTTLPIISSLKYNVDRGHVNFNISVIEKNFNKINYIDNFGRPQILCSRLNKYNECVVQKSFTKGNHDITLIVLDKAGNSALQNINIVL
ncbi:MAG: S8 family serine peptidase [Nanoarchaeota archaeon]|nr:S8 family serine peptidase [Nanoarchaeota archaeon]